MLNPTTLSVNSFDKFQWSDKLYKYDKQRWEEEFLPDVQRMKHGHAYTTNANPVQTPRRV
jgi:hypothetical protein